MHEAPASALRKGGPSKVVSRALVWPFTDWTMSSFFSPEGIQVEAPVFNDFHGFPLRLVPSCALRRISGIYLWWIASLHFHSFKPFLSSTQYD
ncbi:hypothetical protein M758_5G175600 [Ceratodon purpureus]|uniref:Uncharacterized protein n=1 Tax=Ceratodon purpureus TaxID=3225 RepID=A0A8T0I3X7_CERPU|nr:hypothetical protein KC19_5G182600 [Ceratodon purpureus]KAG0617240.1 hypothetical protein M758_5G175600 [Ceratodon purpureus]